MAVDRRRPGRIKYINPALISLLRNPSIAAGEPVALAENDTAASAQVDAPPASAGIKFEADGLAATRGIAIGLVLAIPLWAIIGMIIWWMMFRR